MKKLLKNRTSCGSSKTLLTEDGRYEQLFFPFKKVRFLTTAPLELYFVMEFSYRLVVFGFASKAFGMLKFAAFKAPFYPVKSINGKNCTITNYKFFVFCAG